MQTRIDYEPVSIIPGRGKRDSKIGSLEWNAIGVNTELQALQHLTVLKLREFDQNLAGRMLDLKLLKNGCAVIRDGDVANIVHQHLVQPRWPERAANVAVGGSIPGFDRSRFARAHLFTTLDTASAAVTFSDRTSCPCDLVPSMLSIRETSNLPRHQSMRMHECRSRCFE